jgi:hypothetical protein
MQRHVIPTQLPLVEIHALEHFGRAAAVQEQVEARQQLRIVREELFLLQREELRAFLARLACDPHELRHAHADGDADGLQPLQREGLLRKDPLDRGLAEADAPGQVPIRQASGFQAAFQHLDDGCTLAHARSLQDWSAK